MVALLDATPGVVRAPGGTSADELAVLIAPVAVHGMRLEAEEDDVDAD